MTSGRYTFLLCFKVSSPPLVMIFISLCSSMDTVTYENHILNAKRKKKLIFRLKIEIPLIPMFFCMQENHRNLIMLEFNISKGFQGAFEI